MIDNDIIKALEHCITSEGLISCWKCPALKDNGDLCNETVRISRGLVVKMIEIHNRQKAEIERLIDLINELTEANEDIVRDNHDLYVSLKKRDEEIEELERQIENIEQEAELKWEREEMLDAI